MVSIHAPVWVRPTIPIGIEMGGGFNSRTRVGATNTWEGVNYDVTVSIHAPVWVRRGKKTTILLS